MNKQAEEYETNFTVENQMNRSGKQHQVVASIVSNSAAEKQQQDPANVASEVKRMRISGTATAFKKKVMINHEQSSSAIAAILSKKNRTNNSSSQAEIQPVSDPLMLLADSSDFNIGNQL